LDHLDDQVTIKALCDKPRAGSKMLTIFERFSNRFKFKYADSYYDVYSQFKYKDDTMPVHDNIIFNTIKKSIDKDKYQVYRRMNDLIFANIIVNIYKELLEYKKELDMFAQVVEQVLAQVLAY